jgi:hypothetical protein
MSRFYVLGAQEAVVGGLRRRLRAGQTVCDSSANAHQGDWVCPGLCASPNDRLIALDSSAVAAFATMGITASIGVPLSGPAGSGDSIDA